MNHFLASDTFENMRKLTSVIYFMKLYFFVRTILSLHIYESMKMSFLVWYGPSKQI